MPVVVLHLTPEDVKKARKLLGEDIKHGKYYWMCPCGKKNEVKTAKGERIKDKCCKCGYRVIITLVRRRPFIVDVEED